MGFKKRNLILKSAVRADGFGDFGSVTCQTDTKPKVLGILTSVSGVCFFFWGGVGSIN